MHTKCKKKSFQDSFDLLLSLIYYLVLGSGFNQEMECKVVLAKLTNRRDKKFAQGLALVNWIDHVKSRVIKRRIWRRSADQSFIKMKAIIQNL